MPRVVGIGEDVEEKAVWFVGAGGPDGAVEGFPFLCQVGLDVEVYEEGEVGRHWGLVVVSWVGWGWLVGLVNQFWLENGASWAL